MAPEDKTKTSTTQNGVTTSALPRNGHTRTSTSSPPETTTATTTAGKGKQRHESGQSTVSVESIENYIPTPPDGGWGWVIVVASLFCNVIVDGIGYSFGVFLLEFTEYFKETKSKVSLVGSLLCGIYLFAGPVVSALTNKFGCRPVTVVGSVIAGVSFLLSTKAPSVDILIVTYGVLGGFGLGMMYLPSIVSVGYYFEKKRALATGIAVCGSGIGTFIFAPLSEYLLEELDWKNALLIISGLTLNGAVCGMLMRPLEPSKRKKRPRAKNLLDRIKEQAKGNRARTISETSNYAYSVRDTNAVLEKVMEAKLLREKRLQEDDSELGSLPSIFIVRQQSRKDSLSGHSRVHKLSLSERGEVTSMGHLGSPIGSVPRIVVQDGSEQQQHSSLVTSALARLSESDNSPDRDGPDTPLVEGDDDVLKNDVTDGDVKRGDDVSSKPADAAQKTSPTNTGDVTSTSDATFNDAESGTLWEGSSTDKSEFFTPPASLPPSSPSSPEKENQEGSSRTDPEIKRSEYTQRKSDPEVTKHLVHPAKGYGNGSVPSNIHYHVHEIAPLLEPPTSHSQSKRTLVTLGSSDKNIWRLKTLQAAAKNPATSMHSLSVSKKDLARPLYRKDIFYSGSVLNIPQFQSQPDMKSYITSITTIPGEMALVSGGEAKIWSYLCFPQSVKDTLQEMMDFSLLKDPGFLLVCFGNILTFLGFYVPFVYCVDMAFNRGIDKKQAAFLISIIGIANTIGRVVTGWLADLRKIDSLDITYVSIFICGVSTAVFPFCNSYALLCVNACIFGLSVAAFISLSSILICDLLGLEKLTNGFGLLTMFRGVAAMAGPPLAGFIFDQTKTYDVSFFTGGGLLALGALCHLALKLPIIKKPEPEVYMEVIGVDEIPEEAYGSGVTPELVTIEEVMTSV